MLGSAALSAFCCVVPRAGASRRARMLAGAMVAVMVAVTLDAAPVVQYASTLLLLAVAVATAVGGPAERGPEMEWHRTAAAVLMALAVLMHQHGEPMADHHLAAGPRTDHGTASGHDAALVLLRAATAAYLCWMAAALVRLRNRPITDLLRWEHLAMGASLAAMIFFMS
ncbi:hypothetical protein GA0070214_10675 [Micromonospora chaiyaphumensis]|uniref:Uncharacterized protein n=2 Tax=Micromonospora chaiyaphumensis TaxID=307119 RepID=A0A1C4XJ50_9ACTN|nr:hypothetical protein GA0070214_10675 [Micromonospora chaiyaphumensis]